MPENMYDPSIPIYIQLMDKMREKIFTKAWPLGEKIPAVRELALTFGVNPNTMQRALSELEREGLLYAERTAGRYVTDDEKAITIARREATAGNVKTFIGDMKKLGYTKAETIANIEEIW